MLLKEEPMFGVTLEYVEDYYRRREGIKLHNSPVRDVEKETFWDFALQCSEDFLTPDAVEFLKEWEG